MGHRAEKQMYGSMKNYRAVKAAAQKDSRIVFAEPGRKAPRREQWKPRHIHVTNG